MIRRYELTNEKKFWEIWVETHVYFRFGKIGSQGQTKLTKVASPVAAGFEVGRLVAEKEKQGYKLVSRNADKTKQAKANPDLEKAILADPDAPDGYLVYGDWLTEQGDPLGESIAVQAALNEKPNDRALAKKANELLRANEEAWLGGLAKLKSDNELEATWKNGFLHTVAIGGEHHGRGNGVAAITALSRLSTSRFLRDLELRGCFDAEDGLPSYSTCIGAMVKLGLPQTLKRLAFDVKGAQISWIYLGDLSKLYPVIQGIEELRLRVGHMKLGAMKLPNLKSFEVETGGFSRSSMKSVLGASWPKLEKLVLFFGTEQYGGDCTIKDVLPLFNGKNLPNVTHFALCNAEFQDAIAKAIVGAKITKQLKTLDLSKGTMGDVGAQAILEAAKQFAHLERLDLSKNYISAAMARKLKAAFGKTLNVSKQGDDDDDRYVQVAE